ncbi:type II secretion system F family protein [Fusibacter bizertensis]|uniref:Type II secretion system F family protein n=1 Tax=Fusibacter bizertensis TaxID=1488331 RepID=A0ABT6NA65_9FIRM|nr:type II secretion system F family protein [Fusibacter bizertensis]MDH8677307.1 type II secretion system F family protein [Fusibacter bizertensis]
MLYIAIISFFMVVLLLVFSILKIIFDSKMKVDKRLEYIENIENQYIEEELTFGERVIIPLFNALGKRFLSFSPEYSTQKKRAVLERAGFLKNITYERFVAKRMMTAIVVTLMIGLLSILLHFNLGIIFFLMLWMFAFVQIIYRFATKSAITKRSNRMIKDLPYTLDLITVSVEAGLSLDGAIARIILNIPGVLSDEFAKTLKEMRMGIDKKQALRNMSDRCDVRDVSILVNALIQADELGVSLGRVLRIEGAQLREKRRQAAKEKAMKAPVKMLFPMIIFIFPGIFVIILGPAVIRMIEMFR